MDVKDLIKKIEAIEKYLPMDPNKRSNSLRHAFFITTIQFVNTYIGQETEFYKILERSSQLKHLDSEIEKAMTAEQVLKSLKDYLNLDLDIHPADKYRVRTEVISDFIFQATELSYDKKYHPAAAAILLGASLEEFLKQLIAEKNVDISDVRMSIDPISRKLYELMIISKQDLKDITSWAGLRNDATHGNFEEVNDRKRVQNAIEGVNLFMRKYEK